MRVQRCFLFAVVAEEEEYDGDADDDDGDDANNDSGCGDHGYECTGSEDIPVDSKI